MIDIISTNPKLYVKHVSNEIGYGVFNSEKIVKDEIVEDCYSIVVNDDMNDYKPYYFNFMGNTKLLPLGFGCIYNHKYEPNIGWKIIDYDRKIIRFSALRDIGPNTELCHNYGPNYWKNKKVL